jgi:hypothetical protein
VDDVGEDGEGERVLVRGEGGAGFEAIGEPLEEDAFAGWETAWAQAAAALKKESGGLGEARASLN